MDATLGPLWPIIDTQGLEPNGDQRLGMGAKSLLD